RGARARCWRRRGWAWRGGGVWGGGGRGGWVGRVGKCAYTFCPRALLAPSTPRALYGIGVTGGLPVRTLTTLRAARSYIAVRVSVVALARCGTSTTFSSFNSPG